MLEALTRAEAAEEGDGSEPGSRSSLAHRGSDGDGTGRTGAGAEEAAGLDASAAAANPTVGAAASSVGRACGAEGQQEQGAVERLSSATPRAPGHAKKPKGSPEGEQGDEGDVEEEGDDGHGAGGGGDKGSLLARLRDVRVATAHEEVGGRADAGARREGAQRGCRGVKLRGRRDARSGVRAGRGSGGRFG